MVNIDTNTPATKRKKFMNAFDGKNIQDKDKKTQPISPVSTQSISPISFNKTTIDKPKKLEEKVNNKKIEPKHEIVSSIKKSKKIFGLDAKSVGAVIGIALFFMLSMAGVLIALRQRLEPEKVAIPTAPKSKPAAAEPAPTELPCTLSFYVNEPSPSPSISPNPSPSVSPSPSPSISPSPSPSISPSPSVSPSPSPSPSPSVSPTPSPSVSPSPTPEYACNSNCETNEQCQSANADYLCSEQYTNKCRLDSNPESEECQVKPNEYACNSNCETNEQCQSVNNSYICYQNSCRLDSNPSAQNCQPNSDNPVTIGCNDTCINNGDCSNSEHICYNEACRLATNPTSDTCSSETTYQGTKGGQPVLPTELPASGSEDILDWLKAGLGVMGIGAVLLLLL